MKEFIEKLIGRLEEYKYSHLIERDSGQTEHCLGQGDCEMRDCTLCVWDKAIEIVNQLAEEYKGKYVMRETLNQYMWERDIAVSQLRDLGYGLGERVGWVPCSVDLPKKRDWYLAVFQETDTGFIGLPFIADYLMGEHTNYTTEDGWIIKDCTDVEEDRAEYYKKLKCIAWQPLPAPYQPKGE